jgi:hypothetical protein
MRSVQFTFKPTADDDARAARLKEIGAWPGIERVGQIDAKSRSDTIKRMAFAYLDDKADADDVVRQLRSLPEIASASLPTRRRLV